MSPIVASASDNDDDNLDPFAAENARATFADGRPGRDLWRDRINGR
jgi:hypothetical protein